METNVTLRDDISELQKRMLQGEQVAVRFDGVVNGGMCARTIYIEKGTRLVGGVHLTDHLNICCGDITIFSEESGETRYSGYHVIPSNAGTKRVGIAHTNTIWTTILNVGDLTNMDEIMGTKTAPDFDDPRVLALNKLKEIGE